jgi:pectinesterase
MINFIFSDAAIIFQKCTLLSHLPIPGWQNTITAHGCMDDDASNQTDLSFRFCVVATDDDLSRAKLATMEAYLVQLLEAYSRVVFMESTI